MQEQKNGREFVVIDGEFCVVNEPKKPSRDMQFRMAVLFALLMLMANTFASLFNYSSFENGFIGLAWFLSFSLFLYEKRVTAHVVFCFSGAFALTIAFKAIGFAAVLGFICLGILAVYGKLKYKF